MSKSNYNIEDASAGITDMGLEKTDIPISAGNHMHGEDLNKSRNSRTESRYSNPQNNKYSKNGRNENHNYNQSHRTRNVYPTKKQNERFSKDSSTRLNRERDQNYQTQNRKAHNNTDQSANKSNGWYKAHDTQPIPHTRGKTPIYPPNQQFVQKRGEYRNLSNAFENSPKSDTKDRDSGDHQNYQEGPNISSGKEQQNTEDSTLDSSFYENDPKANTKGWTHNKKRQLAEDAKLLNVQQKTGNSTDWFDSCDNESEPNWTDTTWQENQDVSKDSSTNECQDAQDSWNLSVVSENGSRPNKRDIRVWDYKDSSRRSFGNYKGEVFLDRLDEEKNKFITYLNSKHVNNFEKVQEEERDLFQVGIEYSLAHCVAEDLNMGSGIAVEFRLRFKKVNELMNQHIKTGGLALLKEGKRFIYYLVTKSRSQGKPTYDTLWSSLIEMKQHIKQNGVKKLALPKIGCGLDRLDWGIVKPMLEFLFQDEDLDILVCSLQVEASSSAPLRKCKIIYSTKSVTEIEPETIIIYFASKDGKPTEAMEMLDKKFKFVDQFRRVPKNIGEAIRIVPNFPKNYILYGCVVREKHDGRFDFMAFDKCLRTIIKNYKQDNYYYVAFQKTADDLCNEKILNLMKFTLRDIEIHMCGCSETLTNVEE